MNSLIDNNKYEEGLYELKQIIELNINLMIPLESLSYKQLTCIKLANIYFNNKDYINAKKYILLLKENA